MIIGDYRSVIFFYDENRFVAVQCGNKITRFSTKRDVILCLHIKFYLCIFSICFNYTRDI